MNIHEMEIAVIALNMLDEGYSIHDIMSTMKNISGDVWRGWMAEKSESNAG